ncbi:putative lipoprotein [Spirosoma linguale DSM 74]|uniref:Lipoprotein n=2 Tax=Spirosoma TaxID=107 RepID=D2QBN9_SPILD|nr:putative lipoprotein [Spirosoma linguale DSM 74]
MNTTKQSTKLLMLAGLFLVGLAGCTTVKEYQKNRINDAEMELSARKSEKFEQNFYLYREGAAGANGGKSGGGCGCN